MSPRHRRRPDLAVSLTAVGVAVASAVAILLPVLLIRGDDRPLITAPPVGSTAAATDAPVPAGTAPSAAGRVLPTTPAATTPSPSPSPSPTPPPTSRPAAPSPTASPTPARPTATRAPTTKPPAPSGLRATAWVSGLCLGTAAVKPEQGAAVVQQPCGSPLARRLELTGAALVDRQTGLCVDVLGASGDDGTQVVLWGCSGAANQQFSRRAVADSGGRVQLVAAHSGKCLDVLSRATDAGAAVLQFGCHGSDETDLRNQSWSFGS